MIQRLSHTTIYVTDQDAAHEFYVNKLGFDVRTDQTMGDFRWLTVGPKGQPEMELILMKVAPDFDHKKLGAVGVFDTADCRKTYEELVARGVEFSGPPEEKFYGIEAVFKDSSGNHFSLSQPK